MSVEEPRVENLDRDKNILLSVWEKTDAHEELKKADFLDGCLAIKLRLQRRAQRDPRQVREAGSPAQSTLRKKFLMHKWISSRTC